jgi:hypothetical protein
MIIEDNRKEKVHLTHIEQGDFFEKDGRIFIKLYGGVYNRQEEMDVFCVSNKMIQPMNSHTFVTPLPYIRIVIER